MDCVARDARVGVGFAVTAACIAVVTSTTCVARKSLTARTASYHWALVVQDLEIIRSAYGRALGGDTRGQALEKCRDHTNNLKLRETEYP